VERRERRRLRPTARSGIAEAGRSVAATAAATGVARASRELGLGFARVRERGEWTDKIGLGRTGLVQSLVG
jgi:hypothetical protein